MLSGSGLFLASSFGRRPFPHLKPLYFFSMCIFLLVYIQLFPIIRVYKLSQQHFTSNYSLNPDPESEPNRENKNVQTKFIVHTSNCKLLNLDPFDKVAVQYINQEKKKVCKSTTLILKGKKLKLNSTWLSKPKEKRPICCYRIIKRIHQDPKKYESNADDGISTSKVCHKISTSKNGTKIKANENYVRTECQFISSRNSRTNHSTSNNGKITDIQFYVTVSKPKDHSVKTKLKADFWKRNSKRLETRNSSETNSSSKIKTFPPNVLIIGIDSFSRLQMIRTLPYTREFLLKNDFIEMKGYTRMGENTFPNMMAAMAGMEEGKYPCRPQRSIKLDDCPFIWKNFSRHNYVTAFSEDRATSAVFHYKNVGFVKQPVDYYLRPFTKAYYNFYEVSGNLEYKGCVSGTSLTEHLLDYFTKFRNAVDGIVPYFYFTFFCTASHDSFNALRALDKKFLDTIKQVFPSQDEETVNQKNSSPNKDDNTIIFFISDHGLRTHSIRGRFQGYYEVSLPSFLVRLPPSVKASHPHWYKNLKINSERLTTPLDLFATLEDVLSLSQNQLNSKVNSGDKSGHWNTSVENFRYTYSNWEKHFRPVYSLFEETPENRSCESSLISEKYCRCGVQMSTNVYSPLSKTFSLAVVKKINRLLEPHTVIQPQTNSSLCVPLTYDDAYYNREIRSGHLSSSTLHINQTDRFNFIRFRKGDNTSEQNFYNNSTVKYTDFLIGARVKPSLALFEAKIRLIEGYVNFNNSGANKSDVFEIIGDLTRVNKYQGQSDCVPDSDRNLRQYCYCANLIRKSKTKKPRNRSKKSSKNKSKKTKTTLKLKKMQTKIQKSTT